MQKVIAVCGPTATGKTKLAIALSGFYNAEIISCDSMQIYKGYDIGTAKPSIAELEAVPHHLIGTVEPLTDFSVSDYVASAEAEINKITEKGKMPLIVGGTGLYMRSLLNGLSFAPDTRNDAIRKKLIEIADIQGGGAIFNELKKLDPKAAEVIHENNTKRVIRAVEYCLTTGKFFSLQMKKAGEPRYNYAMICLNYRDRDKLYSKINHRVDLMMEEGLLEEARLLYDSLLGKEYLPTLSQAIGYKEIFPYFDGKINLSEAVENIKQGTRNYAKRQLTWFRREKDISFLFVDDFKNMDELTKQAKVLIDERLGDANG